MVSTISRTFLMKFWILPVVVVFIVRHSLQCPIDDLSIIKDLVIPSRFNLDCLLACLESYRIIDVDAGVIPKNLWFNVFVHIFRILIVKLSKRKIPYVKKTN